MLYWKNQFWFGWFPVNNKDDEMTDDEKNLVKLKDDQEDKLKSNWMILLEIDLNVNIEYTSDLKNCNLDKNHNWINNDK